MISVVCIHIHLHLIQLRIQFGKCKLNLVAVLSQWFDNFIKFDKSYGFCIFYPFYNSISYNAWIVRHDWITDIYSMLDTRY